MSSTLFISRDEEDFKSTWMPSSEKFDYVMERLLDQLEDRELANRVEETYIPGYWANFTKLSSADYQNVYNVIVRISRDEIEATLLEFLSKVDSSTNDQFYYPELSRTIIQLKVITGLDPRLGENRIDLRPDKSIVINPSSVLTASAWCIDLVIEWMSLDVVNKKPQLGRALLDTIWLPTANQTVDLSGLTPEEYCLLRRIDYLPVYFGDPNGGRVAYATNFNATLFRVAPQLVNMYQSDARFDACSAPAN
jgi:hypothetical protein